MYVCVCNAITESAVKRAVAAQPGTIADVYRALDAHPTCGKCVPMVCAMARDAGAPALTGHNARS